MYIFSGNQADRKKPCLPTVVHVADLQHSGLTLSAFSLVTFLCCGFDMNRFNTQPESGFLFQNTFFQYPLHNYHPLSLKKLMKASTLIRE
jgi:hypothetical protein